MEEQPPEEAQFNVSIPDGNLRRLLRNINMLQDRVQVAELQAQNTEYWNDAIDMQREIHDLEVENNMFRTQIEILETAVMQSIRTNMRLENRILRMQGRMRDLDEANVQLVEQVVNLQ